MSEIKNLQSIDLPFLYDFISREKNEFSKFINNGWTPEIIENHFKKYNNFSIGYFIGNKLNAIMIGEKITNNENFDLDIHIFLVSKDKRRNNVGSNILSFVEKNKDLNHIKQIYLEVSENNFNAIKFYEKNNFVFLRFRHNYYKDKNKFISAKCYSKVI